MHHTTTRHVDTAAGHDDWSRRRRAVALAAGTTLALVALTACSSGEDTAGGDDATSGTAGGTVTLVTHDSFAVSDDVLAAFEEETGLTVEQVAPGDGGALVNQLVLTKGSPLGDVVFGIDNSFATRAIDEGVLDPYTPADLPASAERYAVGDGGELTPVDLGDVCINVDHTWFTEQGVPEPVTLEALRAKPLVDRLANRLLWLGSPYL